MTRYALVALVAMSCGYPQPKDQTGGGDGGVFFMDARPDAVVLAISSCDAYAQTGCAAGQKCAWIIDFATPAASLGHAGCAPSGTTQVGAPCTRNPPGVTGWDDCVAGAFCFGAITGGAGMCKPMCDNTGSGSAASACPTTGGPANLGYACATYSGMPQSFGVCDPTCDALADNDFMGSGHKSGVGYSASTGNVCSSVQGCYGVPSSAAPTKFSCSGECASTGSDCPSLTNKAVITGVAYLNACAQGYVPLFFDSEGSSLVDCTALCKPLDCYSGNCGTGASGNLGGGAPHQCNNTYARGSFKVSTLGVNGVNGDQCQYSWTYELDQNGNLVHSATSNAVGFCFDHSRFLYDPTGGTNPTFQSPKCDTLPLTGSGNVAETVGGVPYYTGNAADWGCVSSTTAGIARPDSHFPVVRVAYPR